MIIALPTDWPTVPEDDFVKFLEGCDDYRTDSVANAKRYYFAHDRKVFAVVTKDKVFVSPEIKAP